MKAISALMRSLIGKVTGPHRPFTVMPMVPSASGFQKRAMSGLMMLETIALTTAVNAAPMTTATARSMTFPRRMNSLKPLITGTPWVSSRADGAPVQAPEDAGEAFASDFDDVEDGEAAPPEGSDPVLFAPARESVR